MLLGQFRLEGIRVFYERQGGGDNPRFILKVSRYQEMFEIRHIESLMSGKTKSGETLTVIFVWSMLCPPAPTLGQQLLSSSQVFLNLGSKVWSTGTPVPPRPQAIVYSTRSVHVAENEAAVDDALASAEVRAALRGHNRRAVQR